jgi:hypothetical protein
MYSMLDQMKVAPKITYGRVNLFQATPHEVKKESEKALGCSKVMLLYNFILSTLIVSSYHPNKQLLRLPI